ncbi:MAG: DNA mismatch repair protein MutS, partial [Candidatus Margulisbacteria bacterium]|nr:DNA mismatch repair protein MutS [Candidatus Margulisiibacteriota bacterium]
MFETPMLKQYQEIKAKHEGSILFFRLGDFYEMFLEDAKVASKLLGLTLTGRGKDLKRIPMCGIPHHSADNYIKKLIREGHKVAVCEQVEDPALAKGITKREVVKTITPGTVMSEGVIDEEDNNYLVCVSSHSKGFGLGFVDISTGEFKISSISDLSDLKMEVNRLLPKEILIPENMAGVFEDVLTNVYIPDAPKRAEELLLAHFKVHSLSGYGVDHLSQAFPVAWGLLNYLKSMQGTELPHITKLAAHDMSDRLYLDHVTIQNLEVVQNVRTDQKMSTLFGILDKTQTAMGARFLKQRLMSPFGKIEDITLHLDALESLIADIHSREDITEILSQVNDLERLISRIVTEKNNPRDLVVLKQSLVQLTKMGDVISTFKAPLWQQWTDFFQKYSAEESPYMSLISLLENALKDEVPVS